MNRRNHKTPGNGAVARKPSAESSPGKRTLAARAESGPRGVAENADCAVDAASSSCGSPLPDSLRGKFEGSLGVDLSRVRAHVGEASATANESVNARAYAVGDDIHFGAGEYDPSSADGQHLIAHEVAHTVQQSGGSNDQLQFKLDVSDPSDAAEIEADRAASAMVAGQPATIESLASSRMIARWPKVPIGNRPGQQGTHNRPPLLPPSERIPGVTPGASPATQMYWNRAGQLTGCAMDVLGLINQIVADKAARDLFVHDCRLVADWERKKHQISITPDLRWGSLTDPMHGTFEHRDDGAMGEGWTRKPSTISREFFNIRCLPWTEPSLIPSLFRSVRMAQMFGTLPVESESNLRTYFANVDGMKKLLKDLTIDADESVEPNTISAIINSLRPAIPTGILEKSWPWYGPQHA